MKNKIPVTKPFIPPLEEYTKIVSRAFQAGWLTNRGQLVQDLEDKISSFLELQKAKIICMNNGTIPLQIALKILGNEGEIITTPFSYVATTSSIVWENCVPVFVDIHPEYLNIDETKIEAAITPKTTCILATHVFGNPCNVEKIDKIAKKHNLKVIYDAAHCFGVRFKEKSIFEYGDISTCSFHATKIFHTAEGGAVFCKDNKLLKKMFLSHIFGHINDKYINLGINGKMSELHAAMGICVLNRIDSIIKKRKEITGFYDINLSPKLQKLELRDKTKHNYSYYPIIFEDEKKLNKIMTTLNNNNIFPRRYFYPSLNTMPFLKNKKHLPLSEHISKTIICLPMYKGLNPVTLSKITKLINKSL